MGVAHVGLCRAHDGTVHCRRGRARGCVEPLWADVLAEHTRVRHTMMMSFMMILLFVLAETKKRNRAPYIP
jgi:hypothetical protein